MPGVYISYPFCSQKCSFCNFASGVSSGDAKVRYTQALLDEMRAHRWMWQPETLYFGGGTPSLMPSDELRQLMDAMPRGGITESTLECAPGTVSASSAANWRRLGINRVSLGVQSFVTGELRQTGRRHTAEIVEQELRVLREAGLANVNIDLIAGLPGQTRDSWRESLGWIERLRPPHVSVYIFEVDEESRLGKEAMLGGVRYGAALLPSDDVVAELYQEAVSTLHSWGIARYEISNFAAAGYESRHNLKYWMREPYVGFGLDAHSFDGQRRWGNPDDLETYCAGVAERRFETVNADEERFFVGLRLSAGIQPSTEEWARYQEPIVRWTAAGMLEQRGDVVRLTDRGVLLSNEILQDFLHD